MSAGGVAGLCQVGGAGLRTVVFAGKKQHELGSAGRLAGQALAENKQREGGHVETDYQRVHQPGTRQGPGAAAAVG